jgi:hypothetical protein
VYAPRSGSTLLAKTLADVCGTLLVVPEFRALEFLLSRSEDAVRRLTPGRLTKLMRADRQLGPNLGLSRDALDRVAESVAGGSTSDILAAIVSSYTGGAVSHDVLLKMSTAGQFPERLREVSPAGSVVRLSRDGRAVVSSLLRTQRAYFPGETMARDDVVHACRVWAGHQQAMRELHRAGLSIVSARYEDLVERPVETCQAVATGLGLRIETRESSRRFTVSPQESQLHPLISEEPTSSRSRAWISELPRSALVFADWRLRDDLRLLGYDDALAPAPTRAERARSVAAAYPRHVWLTIRYLMKRASALLGDPTMVAEHLHARLVVRTRHWRAIS